MKSFCHASFHFLFVLCGVGCTVGELSAQQMPVVPLFDRNTALEPATTIDTPKALITRIGDRVRDRHARESGFKAYDHYLSFYWEQRTVSLEFVDRVAKGGEGIEVNIRSLTPLNKPNFRCFYRGLNTVAEYHLNAEVPEVAPNEYRMTIRNHPVRNRPLRVGDRMEFEFSPFLLEPRHGRKNYYGTTMLYIVGRGIVPWQGVGRNLDSVPLPDEALLGGGMTLSYQYSDEPAERFKQLAGNISPNSVQRFMLGRRLHHTNMLNGSHSEQPNPVFAEKAGLLGPHYVASSCISCHVNNGRALPPGVGQVMDRSVVKVAADQAGAPHPVLGNALQPFSLGNKAEGSVSITRYREISGRYGDGDVYQLRQPVYAFSGPGVRFHSVRLTPQLVGLGLLEAVSEQDLFARADIDDRNGDGISGRPQIINDPLTGESRLGRFGYKAGQARLRDQIAAALNSDMGVTTSTAPRLDANQGYQAVEFSNEDLDHLQRYIALLGINARRDLDNRANLHGESLFRKIGCASCHVPSLKTGPFHPFAELRNQTIHPYTDLLLHDMGEGLADNLGEGRASGAEWRTSPLWGIGLTRGVSGGEAYLHDGRARTLAEAILWHGGEGRSAREAFRNLSRTDRRALIGFLQSL